MLEHFTWYKQSGYRWRGDGLTVYIDPWELTGDPEPADVIFITHAHYDHYSPDDLGQIRKDTTPIVAPRDVAAELSGDVTAVGAGDTVEAAGVKAQVVPAYNIVPEREEAHPKANGWVGYILELGGATCYHAGDTDHLPELEDVRANLAFLPIGGTYTMEPAEAGGLAKKIGPEIAVPMHYGFVVGSPSLAEEFRREAEPVTVEILQPERSFEQT
jgi:L-ascorbate metabolism protein UlaG (beta-lactamase superfamily)